METENYNCFASYNEFPTVFQLNKGNQLCWPRSWVCQPVLIHSLQASNWDNPLESKKEVILAKNNVTRPQSQCPVPEHRVRNSETPSAELSWHVRQRNLTPAFLKMKWIKHWVHRRVHKRNKPVVDIIGVNKYASNEEGNETSNCLH